MPFYLLYALLLRLSSTKSRTFWINERHCLVILPNGFTCKADIFPEAYEYMDLWEFFAKSREFSLQEEFYFF